MREGRSQEIELEGLCMPLKPWAGSSSLLQAPARAGPRAGGGARRKTGYRVQFWSREGQGWEPISPTPILRQSLSWAPGHTVRLTQVQTEEMSDQI